MWTGSVWDALEVKGLCFRCPAAADLTESLGMKCGPLALTLPPWSLQADPHGLHSQKLLHPSLHHCPSIMRSDHLEAVQWALEPCNPPTSGRWRFASQDSRSMVKEERASVPLASPEVLPGSWSPRGSLIYPIPASFLGSQQDGLGETELKQIHVCFFLKDSKIGSLLSDSFGPQSISLFSPLTRAPFCIVMAFISLMSGAQDLSVYPSLGPSTPLIRGTPCSV